MPWQTLHCAFAPSKSPACALAAPVAQIDAQAPIPGGGRLIDWNARASRSLSPDATAPPATLFIQRCIGQSGLPLSPHSQTRAGGLSPLALVAGAALALPLALGGALPEALAAAEGRGCAGAMTPGTLAEGSVSKSAMMSGPGLSQATSSAKAASIPDDDVTTFERMRSFFFASTGARCRATRLGVISQTSDELQPERTFGIGW